MDRLKISKFMLDNAKLSRRLIVETALVKGREEGIDEYMQELCEECMKSENECVQYACPMSDMNGECKIIKIAERLKERK